MTRDAALLLWSTLRERVITDEVTLPDVIDDLSSHICGALPVSGAGLLISTSGRRHAVLGASDDRMRRLEQLQATFEEGPCMDTVRSGRFVGEANLEQAQQRWPLFGPAAVAAGIAAAFSFPVMAGPLTIGALDCYHVDAGVLSPGQIRDGSLFADIAADLIMRAQTEAGVDHVVDQMTASDQAPALLKQATGMIAFRLSVTVPEARELLHTHARDHDTSLDAVAAAVIDGTAHVQR